MTPEISVIIPVLNEATRIVQTLDNLVQCAAGVSYEVIVVDGDRAGSTIAQIPQDRGENISTLSAPPGRGLQMNWGAQLAQAPILLFLHADSQLPPKALKTISLWISDPSWVGGAFDLEIDSGHWSLQWIARLACLRSRLTRIPYGDQAIFLRTEYFHTLGGYPAIAIMEDVALMRQIRRRRDQICFLSDRVLVSPRRWETEGILYCTLRNWLLLSLYSLGVSPQRLASWYQPSGPQV